jgi:predicted ATP-binding protein involved in virulence
MLLLFDWLSDGERSFLARMALFALFRADNLLILLDEPEVHFNDVWKREIVQKLDEIMRGCASHAIITTHSSIALSDVPPDDVLVLRRDGQFTTGEEHPPGVNTFGADPSDIMVHVFRTLSPNGERSRTFIRQEIGKRNTVKELDELSDFVAPGYWRYRIQLEAQSKKDRLQ